MDPYFTVKSALEIKFPNKGASSRWLRDQIPLGLRCVRVGGKLFFKESWIDEYIEKFEVENEAGKIDMIVNEVCGELK